MVRQSRSTIRNVSEKGEQSRGGTQVPGERIVKSSKFWKLGIDSRPEGKTPTGTGGGKIVKGSSLSPPIRQKPVGWERLLQAREKGEPVRTQTAGTEREGGQIFPDRPTGTDY